MENAESVMLAANQAAKEFILRRNAFRQIIPPNPTFSFSSSTPIVPQACSVPTNYHADYNPASHGQEIIYRKGEENEEEHGQYSDEQNANGHDELISGYSLVLSDEWRQKLQGTLKKMRDRARKSKLRRMRAHAYN